jgi:hypothetical protein
VPEDVYAAMLVGESENTMSLLPDEEDFDRRWLHASTEDHNLSVISNLAAVKDFAYKSFDVLDKDGNGFIETHELTGILESGSLDNREKSFVVFLLNNREQIAQMNDEGSQSPVDGISRSDIEAYFALLANLL